MSARRETANEHLSLLSLARGRTARAEQRSIRRLATSRVAGLTAVLFGVSLLTFGLGTLAPGDPAELILQARMGQPTAAQIAAMAHQLGTDRPVPVQYLTWLGHALSGNLGSSWSTGQSVASTLVDHLPATAELAVSAWVLAVVISVPLGIVSAYRRNSMLDRTSRVGALVGASIPGFFLGYLLILVFAVDLKAFPVFGSGSPAHIVLPAVTLAAGVAAPLSRLTRSTMLEVLREDYIKMARAKGMSRGRLLVRHALPNAIAPVLTQGTLAFAALLNGGVVVETVFAWPGIGQLAVQSVQAHDYPMVQGFVLLAGVTYVLFNFCADLAHGWLDPRARR